MSPESPIDSGIAPDRAAFTTTRWSLVLAAQGDDSVPADKALASLCETYWYPLYAFVRRRGHNSHDAQDLTQAFFEKLLEKNYVGDAVRERGRFRSFLLGSLKHFLANEWHHSRAEKRGGKLSHISLDSNDAEGRYRQEPTGDLTAEQLFDRRWAVTLLDRVMNRLRSEMDSSGKAKLFDELKVHLSAWSEAAPFAESAARLGIEEGTARVAAHRLKKRYRELIREEISQTVSVPSRIDDEIRYLISVLSGTSGTS